MKQKNNILIITYWDYHDALIQAYTLPYVKIMSRCLPPGSTIYLVTLDRNPVPVPKELGEFKIRHISLRYYPFGLSACFHWIKNVFGLMTLIRKEKISTIHAWCTPAGAIGYFLSLISRKRLILDSYEPHAQSMVENGTWKRNGPAFHLLWYLEKKQTQRAFAVIATTSAMKDYAKMNYQTDIKKFYVKPACVDLKAFSLEKRKNGLLVHKHGLSDKIVCLYAGKFGGIYLKEEVFEFFQVAYAFWKNKLKIMLLTGHSLAEIEDLARRYQLPMDLFIVKKVSHEEIPVYIGLADFALTPVKPVPSKRLCSPIKDGEYWAMGIPVIIPYGISDDSEIIEASKTGYVWKKIGTEEYKKSILFIDKYLSENTTERVQKIRHLAETYRNYKLAETVYQDLYGILTV